MRWVTACLAGIILAGCLGEDKPSSSTAIKIAQELQLQEPFIHASKWAVVNGYSEKPGKYTAMIQYTAEFKKSPKEIALARVEDLKLRGVPWIKMPWPGAIEEHLREKYGRYITSGSIVDTEIKLTLTKTQQGWALVDAGDAPTIL